jgi:protein-disulfide isomerase
MPRRPEIRERRQRERRRQRLTFVFIVLAAVIVVAAGILYPRVSPVGEIAQITPIARPQVDGRQIGDPNAPVLVELFEDFQCPGCREFTASLEPQLIDAYVQSGEARIVFRFYAFIGPESVQAANASLCADEQGRFWDYHDMLFANQQGENQGAFTDRRLEAFAEALGLDMPAFRSCFGDSRYEQEIAQDRQAGGDLGVTSTPSIVVAGQLVTSANPGFIPSFQEIAAAIDAALASRP